MKTEHGNDRDETVFQGVAQNHHLFAQAFGPGGANIVLTYNLQQAGAGQAGD